MTAIGFPCVSETLPDGWDQPLDPTKFRALFAAFADETIYPDPTIQVWLDQAPVDPCVWGDRYQLGQALWAAHELTKFGPQGLASTPGATGTGLPASKSVGQVSLSYDNSVGTDPEAGSYNMTLYGRQFWSMLKYLPIGPIQVGPACSPLVPVEGAWIGPWPLPAPGMSGFS
jgi:hypothetical protein